MAQVMRWHWSMSVARGVALTVLLLLALTGCERGIPSRGILPLQMPDPELRLVAAEVHFFHKDLDLVPLQEEIARVDNYISRKRYRYAPYEPLLSNDLVQELIDYSARLRMPELDHPLEEAIANDPGYSLQEQEFYSLQQQLNPYLSMIKSARERVEQLTGVMDGHLEAIAQLEQSAQNGFNSYIRQNELSLPLYHFVDSPFIYHRNNKVSEQCPAEKEPEYQLLTDARSLDTRYCWYLRLPEMQFKGTSVEQHFYELFELYYPHHEAVSDTEPSSLNNRLKSAQQALRDISDEAKKRFGVTTAELERYHYLEQLIALHASTVSTSGTPEDGLQQLRLRKLKQLAARYKATFSLNYLFERSFSSKIVGRDGRFELPGKAAYMLVYGLYGPDVQRSKEFFWFVDLQKEFRGFEDIELMTLPEKPQGETLLELLKLDGSEDSAFR